MKIRKHATLKEALNPKTAKIGKQVWSAENLALDDGGEGIYVADDGTVYYTQDAAIRIANSVPGWHLPTAAEWKEAGKSSANLQKDLGVELNGYHVIGDLGEDTYNRYVKGFFWTPEKTTGDGSFGKYAYFTNGPKHDLYFLTNRGDSTAFMANVRLVKD